MENSLYPAATPEIAQKREQLTPETLHAWRAFSRQAFPDGALPAKTKDLIAIAAAHVTKNLPNGVKEAARGPRLAPHQRSPVPEPCF